MMKYKQIVILLLVMTPIFIMAQEIKFKKVSEDDLLKSKSLIDPEATAEYLYRSCKAEYEFTKRTNSFELVYTYFYRIKIYDDSDLSIGDRRIRYFVGGKSFNDEEVTNVEGYTFNLEDGRIVKEKLDVNNIYDEKLNRYSAVKKFAMPSLKKGSVLDIKYKVRSVNIGSIKKFYFQSRYPVVHARYKTNIPEYFTYSNNVSGYHPMEMQESSKNDAIRVLVRNENRNAGYGGTTDFKKKYTRLPYIAHIREFTATDIPSLQDEPFVNNMINYKLGIGFELLSTQFPDSIKKYYSKNWLEIGKAYNEYSSFGDELRRNYEFADLLESMANLEDVEKMRSIYNTVRDTFNWNDFFSDVTNEGIDNLIETGSGNSAEINLLLTNLLRSAGLLANPILMRHRESGNLNVNYPTRSDLNYVIVQVQLDDQIVYLDATDKHLRAGQLPRRAINIDGILVNNDGGSQLTINNRNINNLSRVIELEVLDGGLKGTCQEKYRKYSAYKLHSLYNSDLAFIDALNSNGGVTITEPHVTGFDVNVGNVSISGKVNCSNYIQKIDGKYFIDYALDILPKTSPFVKKERQFALFFDSRQRNTGIVKFSIPKGYIVESLPESMNVTLPENMMSCVVQFNATETDIIVTIRNSRKVDMISPEYYEFVLEFYDLVIAKGNEKIILSKV